jgi:hypothetical protein
LTFLFNVNIILIEGLRNLKHDEREEHMEAWRVEAARKVKETMAAEGLTVEEAAKRFAIRPTRVKRILRGDYEEVG